MNSTLSMIWKELLQVSNRGRFALQKVIVAGVVATVFVIMVYDQVYESPYVTYQSMARFGRGFFFAVAAVLAILMPLAAMVFGTGIVVSEKVGHRLALLMVTPLRGPAIVGSKAVSVFARVTVGLLVGLPALAMLAMFGGVDSQMVIWALVIILSNVWLYGTLGLAASVLSRNVTLALARAAFVLVAWNLLPLFWALIFFSYYAKSAGPTALAKLNFFDTSPFFVFIMIMEGPRGMSLGQISAQVYLHGAINLVLGGIFLLVAFLAFRPMARRLLSGVQKAKKRRRAAKKEMKRSARPHLTSGFARLSKRFGAGIIARELAHWRPWKLSLPLLWLMTPWVVVLFASITTGDYPELMDSDFHWVMYMIEAIGFFFCVSLLASIRIVREKEGRTLKVLLLTRLGRWRILGGKAIVILLQQSVGLLLLAAHLALIVRLDLPSIGDVLVMFGGLVTTALFCVLFGLYFSLAAKRTVASIIITAGAWVFGVVAGMAPAAMVGSLFGLRNDWEYVGAVILVVLSGVAILLTIRGSARRRGFGLWLALASYATISASLIMLISWSLDPNSLDVVMEPVFFLPAASLSTLDFTASGVSVATIALPLQIGMLIWMAVCSLWSFEAQVSRGE